MIDKKFIKKLADNLVRYHTRKEITFPITYVMEGVMSTCKGVTGCDIGPCYASVYLSEDITLKQFKEVCDTYLYFISLYPYAPERDRWVDVEHSSKGKIIFNTNANQDKAFAKKRIREYKEMYLSR